MAKVIIPTPLRKFTSNQSSFQSEKESVEDVLKDLVQNFPAVKENLFDSAGNIRKYIKVFVGDQDFESSDKPKISADTVISIIPAIAGGYE